MSRDRIAHREQVERASFADHDGLAWFDGQVWPDGLLLNRLFWDHYASHIAPHNHGRALRALARATPHGMKAFSTVSQFREMLKQVMTPFWETKRQRSRRQGECPYCTRPYESRAQCQGCGAWRRVE